MRSTGLGARNYSAPQQYSARSLTIHSFLPRRFVVSVKTLLQAYYVTGTAQPGGIFSINASAFYQPFSNGVVTKIGTTGSGNSNFQLSASYSVNQSPVGYQELSGLYQYYKVIRARLKLESSAQNTADAFTMTCCPNNQQISALSQVTSLASNPFGKQMMITAGSKARSMVFRNSTCQVNGLSSVQFEGPGPSQMGSAPSNTIQWFYNVAWEMNTPGNPAGALMLNISLEQLVEVFNIDLFTL